MKRLLRVSAVLLLAATATSACGGDDKDSNDATDTTTAAVTAATSPRGDGTVATLQLVAKDIKFDKASLTAKADQPLAITLTNNDSTEHNITIEKLDVDKDVEGGESATTDTVTPAAGTYEFHCEYHPAAMKGELIVS